MNAVRFIAVATALGVAGVALTADEAQAGRQNAIDGCIDGVRAEAGGGGGQVLAAERQGPDWYVHLEDGFGGEWDCYAADDGTVEQLTSVAPANAGGGSQTKEARRACRRALRREVGRGGIEIQSAEFSQANTLVMLTDRNGQAWRCLSSNSGEVAELVRADGGGGAGRPSVGSATDLTAFEGAPAGQAEGGIRALGYEDVRSDGLTTYWFNRETGACAAVTTSDGRYSQVRMLPAEDC